MHQSDKTIFILANNNGQSEVELLSTLINKESTLICCDGAANALKNTSIVPDIIIGDLDSISESTKSFFESQSVIIEKPSQYQCDLEKALDYCVEQGFKKINILGLSGGRADYAIANFIVLKHYCDKLNIKILAKDYTAYPVTQVWEQECKVGQKLSFIPFGECVGITLKGLKYELNNATMHLGDIGVSNEVSQNVVRISIKSGYVCIFIFN